MWVVNIPETPSPALSFCKRLSFGQNSVVGLHVCCLRVHFFHEGAIKIEEESKNGIRL